MELSSDFQWAENAVEQEGECVNGGSWGFEAGEAHARRERATIGPRGFRRESRIPNCGMLFATSSRSSQKTLLT